MKVAKIDLISEIFGTFIKSVWLLLAGHSQLSGVIHLAEHEEIVGLAVEF